MRNIAICSTVVAMVAPAVAQAQDPASIALAGQVTVVIDGAFTGATGPLTVAGMRQVEMAVKGLVTGALANGLTYEQISWALSRGVAKSIAPKIYVQSLKNGLQILAHDTWAFATGAMEVLKNLPLPTPLLMIIVDPAMDGSGASMPMAHLWDPFDHDYYTHDYGNEEEEDAGWSGGGVGIADNEDYQPGGDRPETKYNSEEHEDGYWVAGYGCFPPTPGGYYLSDATVPCTGHEVAAPIITIPAIDIQSMSSYMVEAHAIPFGVEGEDVLLLPVEDSPGMVPTIVHFF